MPVFSRSLAATVGILIFSVALSGCSGDTADGDTVSEELGTCEDYKKGGAGKVSDVDSCKKACKDGEGFADGNVSKWEGPKMFATEAEAITAATDHGCEGAHQMGAEWMPGATHGACKMGKCDCRKDESSEWSPTCDEKKGKKGGPGGHHDHDHDSHGNHSGHRMLAEEEDALYA